MRGSTVFLIIYFIVSGNFYSFGQLTERCLTTGISVNKRINADPDYARYHRKHTTSLMDRTQNRNPACQQGPVVIPVAVHFNSGIVPVGQEACAVSLVMEQLEALNAEINGDDPQNSAYTNLQYCFPGNPAIGESCVSFCLARYDHPSGYDLEPGSYAVTFGKIDFSEISPGSNFVPLDENWSGYLNIFIDDLPGSLLGESAGIPGMFNGEGVVIDACAFGTGNSGCEGMNTSFSCGGIYNEGNTLIHEVGHYLGLYHIWGDNPFCTGFQDGIEDTPGMTSGYSGFTDCDHSDCTDLPSSCDSKDMYMNYMSYASDGCMYMFTSGQADLLHQSAINAGFSQNLPLKCITPEFPVASFSFDPDPVILCPNLPFVHFSDDSAGPAESWQWTFDGCGVIPTNSNIKNPVVQVKNSGTLTVQLTAGNFLGTSQTITQVMSVELLASDDPECNSCQYQLELTDSYGDGWNGANIEVFLDDQSAGIFTISDGDVADYEITVGSDQDLQIVFTGGQWDEEVSFILRDAFGADIFVQGPNPADGLIFAGKSNCSVCGYRYFDSGGLSGQYKNSENKSRTFCPPVFYDKVRVNFELMDIESAQNCEADQLQLFNGADPTEFLGAYCGFDPTPDVISSAENGCLHFVFTSDESVTREGWSATLICENHCNVVSGTFDSVPNSLRSAIECAQSGDTVFLHPFLIGDTIIVDGGPITIDKTIVLLGQAGAFSIDCSAIPTLFHVFPQGNFQIIGLQITGKSTFGNPMMINEGILSLDNTYIVDQSEEESISILNSGNIYTYGTTSVNKTDSQ